MKKTFIWLVASLLFTIVGCVEALHEPGMAETSSEQLPDLTAGFAEGETKTYVESGKHLRWHEDDRLTAFYGNTLNRQYKFNGATGNNSGSFSYVPSDNLETGNAIDRIYAVYPYDETTTITDNGQISLILPAVQTYAENSFGRGANTMLAATKNVEDTFLAFKNACGYLKLKLYNAENATIKSIEVKGNGEEKIAGAATATIAFGEVPQLTMADDAATTIMLDCGDGVALGTTAETATEFWVVVPEITFEGGITITVTDTEGGIFEKSTTKEVVIERNTVQPMAVLEATFKKLGPANNEIWYTATKKVVPYKTDVFGANIESNEWDEATGEGVITFDGEVTTIGDSAFESCNLTSVTIPDSVVEIGEFAFYACKGLTSVTIPNGVTEIKDYTFGFCKSLTSVTIPNSIISIGYDAFYNCSSLTSVTIPDSVTTIVEDAFTGCSNLTSVTISNSVTTIGEGAFKNCVSLKSVYCKATTPPCLGRDAFTYFDFGVYKIIGCDIYVPAESVSVYNSTFFGWKEYAEYIIGYDFEKGEIVPDSPVAPANKKIWYTATAKVEPYKTDVFGANIESNEWDEATGEGVITFDGEVTKIGDYAFYLCRSLTSVTIPDSVIDIGNRAFNGCSSLISVTIPDSVITIGYHAFNACRSLTSVTIPDSVLSIGYEAFSSCSSLISVTIPDSVTSIGQSAFSECSSLQEFKGGLKSEDGRCLIIDGVLNSFAIGCGATDYTIPDGVTSIGHSAFCNCSSLTNVTIPNGVTEIEGWAFYGCSSLTNVTIPDSVTSIEYYAFRNCSSLTSITIPDSVTTIGEEAFYECINLKSVTLGCCVTTIENGAFCECSSLTSVTIPDSVISIGEQAFVNCSSLKSVTISDSVTLIEEGTFANCKSLTSVYCRATTPPSLGDIVFKYYKDGSFYNIGCKIYVPVESANAYKSASGWSEYKSYIVGHNF